MVLLMVEDRGGVGLAGGGMPSLLESGDGPANRKPLVATSRSNSSQKTGPMAYEIDNSRKVGGDFVEQMNAP